MAFMNPFRTPKHQQYNYIPRYWNPDKEDLENRVKQAQGEVIDEEYNPLDMKVRISNGFARRASMKGRRGSAAIRGTSFEGEERKMRKRVAGIVAVLVIIAYILIRGYIPGI